MKKIRVGVLMGGMSIEKEISFNSGRTICDHLDSSAYNIVPLFQTTDNQLYLLPWKFLYRGKISDFEHRLEKEANSAELLKDQKSEEASESAQQNLVEDAADQQAAKNKETVDETGKIVYSIEASAL